MTSDIPAQPNFQAARKRIWDDLVSLHDAWAQYQYLFGDAERVRILNACARWFFGLTQRTLLREVILGISRLTDPVKSGKHANLVLASLLLDPAVDDHPDLREELQDCLEKVSEMARDIRLHRHKYIAHRDHATAMGSAEEPFPGLRTEAISAVIDAMGEVYNLHGGRIHDSHAIFELAPLGGSDALVRILETSERWHKWQEIQRRREELR